MSLSSRKSASLIKKITDEEVRYLTHSRRIDIHFLGVWDTVGTVGVPVGNISGFSRSQFTFRHTRWSTLYKNFAHALAIDEKRKDYLTVMLYDYIPDGEPLEEINKNLERLSQSVEQRWFPGVHSNIGGGYRDNALAVRPLRWILLKAKDAGLDTDADVVVKDEDITGKLVDSYSAFLGGAYKYLPWTSPVEREINASPREVTRGKIIAINETVDDSAAIRWKRDPSYRPENLKKYFDSYSSISLS